MPELKQRLAAILAVDTGGYSRVMFMVERAMRDSDPSINAGAELTKGVRHKPVQDLRRTPGC